VTSSVLSLIAFRSDVVIAAREKFSTIGATSGLNFKADVITTADFGTTKYFIT
jgi:hypothetical protein